MTHNRTVGILSELASEAPSELEAYQKMLRIRLFEARCLELSKRGLAVGSMHLCAGQEAVPVGAVSALHPEERVVATYRGHGWAISCGAPLPDLLAEICHRETGINGGRAGSAYLTAPQHRFVGENSVVGAGVPIAAGIALAERISDAGAGVLVSIGDGATSQGATHEGLVFAVTKRLPLVIVCENNGWSEMTALREIVPLDNLAQRASGYGMPGVTVDGCDPVAVYEAVAPALERARSGEGPTFVECKTVRLWGHYNADIEHYRPDEDKRAAEAADPLARLREAMLASGTPERELAQLEEMIAGEIDEAESFALASPTPDPSTAREHVVRVPVAAADSEGTPPEATKTTYVLAVNTALREELAGRPELLVFGEDVGVAGGVFGATRNLQKEFGSERVFDTPIAESAILGAAVGLAMAGYRPVVEIMWSDFLLVALDQLVNQAANVRYISRGRTTLPIVVRTQQGVTPGSCAQHSQSLEALLAHVPGLRVGLPGTPQDAYAMLRAAIADEDPCVLIECRALYQTEGLLEPRADPSIGGARRYGSGADLAMVTWGRIAHAVRAAATTLENDGIGISVLELRWLSPLDDEALSAIVAATGRVLIVHEANVTGGFGAEVAARIADRHFDDLDAPIRRIGAPDVRFPASPVLQQALLPSEDAILNAARELLGR